MSQLFNDFLKIKIKFEDVDYRCLHLWISETIAFTAALTSYSIIPTGSAVEFNEVLLNEGDG